MKKSIFGILMVLLLPLVSAYGSLFGYYGNPVDFLVNSEWTRFLLLFGIFFALIFFAIKGMLRGNKGIGIVVSVCLSLLITITLAERGWLSGYFGDDLSNWILFVVFIFIFVFIIQASYKNLGPKFTGFALMLMWLIMAFYFTPEALITSGTAGDLFAFIFNLWISVFGFLVTLLIAIALFFVKKKHRGINVRSGDD